MAMPSRAVGVLCLLLPLAISPWAFDDAYCLKEMLFLLVGGGVLFGGAIALWRGQAGRTVLPPSLLVFLILAIASAWQVTNAWLFLFRSALILAGVAVFVAVSQSSNRARAGLLKALCVSATLATGYGFVQQMGLDPFLAPDPRFISTFGNPHLYAEFVAPLLPALLCLVLVAETTQSLALAMTGFTVVSAGLLWSSGRGPILAGLAALVFLLWALRRESSSLVLQRRARLWTCVGILASVMSLMVLTGKLAARKPSVQPPAPRSGGTLAAVTPANPVRIGDLGVDFRLAVYRDTFSMIRERPLTGFGLGNFWVAYPRFAKVLGASFPEMNNEVVPVGHVHNDLLEVAAELGLPAAFVFVWMFLAFVRAGVNAARGSMQEEAWPSLAAGSGLVALGVNGLFAFGFYDPATSLEFWVFAGIAVASGQFALRTPFGAGLPRLPRALWRGWFAPLIGCVGLGAVWLGISSELSDIFLDRGLARFYSGRYAEAVSPLGTAARLEVGRTVAKMMLAQVHMELGDWARSLDVIRGAQGLEPNNPQLYYLRGVVQSRLGRLQEAQRDQEQALSLYPLYSLPRAALGEVAERRGDFPRAREEYESALRINQRRANARDGLALLAVKEGNLDEAIRLWEEGVRVDPEDVTFAHNLGIAYARKGDPARAAFWQAKAAALRAGAKGQPSLRP